jgi:hypothetical protein
MLPTLELTSCRARNASLLPGAQRDHQQAGAARCVVVACWNRLLQARRHAAVLCRGDAGPIRQSGQDRRAAIARLRGTQALPSRVSALALSDQVLNGHLSPQIEIKSDRARARAIELAYTAGPLVHFRRIAEQRLTVPVVVISHGQFLRFADRWPC